ncbi:hypothetical protein SERLADRAFT_443196 [Serpula lacrymans var. lacrymans S7.9]|uniref:Uncharacterized protein n=1 Tax=Serpula lacrymans var. lacrymans (strain S7.9) TaxID=578457 RepID=F8PBV0_SERL9|nr:uncharacterized protein SERLADRAFT_443196 [Serpula lacrymans var. lacrymans S7.9]EGO19153.1 hypothetical protein SERLADRAFT_443196 [Serpula lacrymans var. lacrymans S7.9]
MKLVDRAEMLIWILTNTLEHKEDAVKAGSSWDPPRMALGNFLGSFGSPVGPSWE